MRTSAATVQPSGRPDEAMTSRGAAGFETRLLGAWRILRPANCGMTALGVGVGAAVAVGPAAFVPATGLAAASAFCATAFGNVLNDITDADIDRLAHPDRPLPHGDVLPSDARALAGIAAAASLGLAALVSPPAVLFVVAALGLMVLYELALKSRGLPGNAAVAILTGAPFLFGGLAVVGPVAFDLTSGVLVLALLAALSNLGREVLKDIEDMAADVGRSTLPQRAGRKLARQVAAAALLVAVVLSPLPWMRGDVAWTYLPVVAIANVAFLSAAFHPRAGRAQEIAKIGMFVALLAFLVGRFVPGVQV